MKEEATQPENKYIVIKDAEGNTRYWMDFETHSFMEKLNKVLEEIMFRSSFGNYPLTDDQVDEVYTRYGLTPPDRTPVRLGHFFMAHVGEDRRTKMLWQEPDGKVYDFKNGATCPDVSEVDTKEYTGKWTFWRAVSSFDF